MLYSVPCWSDGHWGAQQFILADKSADCGHVLTGVPRYDSPLHARQAIPAHKLRHHKHVLSVATSVSWSAQLCTHRGPIICFQLLFSSHGTDCKNVHAQFYQGIPVKYISFSSTESPVSELGDSPRRDSRANNAGKPGSRCQTG